MYPNDYYTMIRSKDYIFDYRLQGILGILP